MDEETVRTPVPKSSTSKPKTILKKKERVQQRTLNFEIKNEQTVKDIQTQEDGPKQKKEKDDVDHKPYQKDLDKINKSIKQQKTKQIQ